MRWWCMPDRMIFRMHQLCRMGLIGISFWVAPQHLCCQLAAPSDHVHSSADQPFAELDNSLTMAANMLLVSEAHPSFPAIRADADATPVTSHATQDDSRTKSRFESDKSAAAIRVNLLLPMIDPILRKYDVPVEFAAVIAVESGGQTLALSPKGARGPWQLMPDTARRYGLRVDDFRDDRLDLLRATDAAAHYLHDLYAQFGDWKLALAAYNTGEINVSSAILKAHSRDFDQLTNLRVLPLETRKYVPRVLASARFIPSSAGSGDDQLSATVFAVSSH
jgi:membrane-bound lytic murein transglycosylase D